jgi:hypothetical protein
MTQSRIVRQLAGIAWYAASIAAALHTVAATRQLQAQPPLGATAPSVAASPAFESWSFAGSGLAQPHVGGSGNVVLSGATQLSLPLVFTLPFGGDRWRIDLASGFAHTSVKLAAADNTLQTDSYSLSGLTDSRLRLTGKLASDRLLITVGLNAPTGKTELDAESLSALRVMAAPAMGFQIPYLGGGSGGTAGMVLARTYGNWAWALGASYEFRDGYAPIAFAGGAAAADFNPGDVFHISLGGDGLVGNHGMSVGLSADIFSEDELSAEGAAAPGTQLGPIITAEWRLRFATTRLQELSLSVVDRFRTAYKRAGETVQGSSGNFLEASLLAVHAASPSTSVAWELSARHHTGMKSDSSLVSAAMNEGGVRVSVSHQLQNGAVLQPFGRLRFANIENGTSSAGATMFSLGLTLLRDW